MQGTQIHNNSLLKTSQPRVVKKPSTLSGATFTGRNAKKYRWLLKGANKATPSPPLVNISRIGWDAVAKKKYRNNPTHFFPLIISFVKNNFMTNNARKNEKKNECVIPRWPNKESYGIPIWKPIASRSGMAAQILPIKRILKMRIRSEEEPIAIATKAWLKADGIWIVGLQKRTSEK